MWLSLLSTAQLQPICRALEHPLLPLRKREGAMLYLLEWWKHCGANSARRKRTKNVSDSKASDVDKRVKAAAAGCRNGSAKKSDGEPQARHQQAHLRRHRLSSKHRGSR